MTPAYQQLLGVLSQYLSSINAQSALNRALRARDLTPETLTHAEVGTLVPLLAGAIGLFIDPAARAELITRLSSLRQRPRTVSHTIPIQGEPSISEARSRARDLCIEGGARSLTVHRLATMVSELARNIVSYTPGGKITLTLQGEPARVTVRAVDRGAGIPNLDEVLAGRFRSRTGLGKGLMGVKKLADRFEIQTGGAGTVVDAEVYL